MMDALEAVISSSDKAQIFLGIIAILVATQFLVKLFDYFKDRFGIETKSMRREREQVENIDNLKSEVDQIKEDQEQIMVCLNDLQHSVNKMQEKSDMNKAAELKDRIGQSYRYYHQSGKITTIEKEALKDLIRAYSQFSSNSFVHSLVEKEMETWEVIERD